MAIEGYELDPKLEADVAAVEEAMYGPRKCDNPACGKRFSPRYHNQLYCAPECGEKRRRRRYYLRQKLRNPDVEEARTTHLTVKELGSIPTRADRARRGDDYDQFRREDWPKYKLGRISTTLLMAKYGVTKDAISKWAAACAEDDIAESYQDEWTAETDTRSLEERYLQPTAECFRNFSDDFFLTEWEEPYEWADHHTKWANAIVNCIERGGKLMILSPPRHGKTKLLARLSIWMIVRRPNIRIAYVGGNQDIAKETVGMIRDHLENNRLLIETFLGPAGAFKPQHRAGKPWTNEQLTVATRTVPGIASPTVVAIGREGTLLSRDIDLFVGDDLEQHKTTKHPSTREDTRRWLIKAAGSRKTSRTAAVLIGSRQNPQDVYSYLLGSEDWETIVETAHDANCTADPNRSELHTDCMLWGDGPKGDERDHAWLMGQLRDSELLMDGGRAMFDMVYLNRPHAEGLQLFDRDAVLACRRSWLSLGNTTDVRLIAGLDPSAVGYQAAFLWGYGLEDGRLRMVDMENHQGGGAKEALTIMQQWYERYGCAHWVVEHNLYHGGILKDPTIQNWARDNWVRLDSHQTDTNKWDDRYGVTGMPWLFEDQMVDLPYASIEAQAKTDAYIRQLLNFSSYAADLSKNRRGVSSDIVMASWFPLHKIRQFRKSNPIQVTYDYTPTFEREARMQFSNMPW